MWVRSYNGEILADCDLFKIADVQNRTYVRIFGHLTGDQAHVDLGMYSNNKAKKILDELTSRIENGEIGVYQMPYEY